MKSGRKSRLKRTSRKKSNENQQKPGATMNKKIFLVYDFEELCGAFSTLPLAKKAVAQHLGLIKHYSKTKAEKMGFGELDFEVYERAAKKSWVYALLVKTKRDNVDLHRRKIAIYELALDEYSSLLKKFMEKKPEQKRLEAPGGD